MKTTSALHLLLLFPLVTTACTDELVSLEERTETQVSASGGTALSAGGELTLAFSAGTVDADSKVVIRTDRASGRANLLSPVFDLSVTPNVTKFDPPVAIRIQTGKTGRATIMNLDGAEPVEVANVTYDAETGIVAGELEHFSSYAAMTPPANNCPTQAPSGACTVEGERCEYGQECCCGQCHPSVVATCSQGNWAVLATDACFAPTCPDAGPAPTCPGSEENGMACNSEGQTCYYGQECCCGQCFPSNTMTCYQGVWYWGWTDACLGGGQCERDAGPAPACPPNATGACSNEGQVCEYGQECCCGECYPSVVATCSGGQWAAMATDACFAPTCPDAG